MCNDFFFFHKCSLYVSQNFVHLDNICFSFPFTVQVFSEVACETLNLGLVFFTMAFSSLFASFRLSIGMKKTLKSSHFRCQISTKIRLQILQSLFLETVQILVIKKPEWLYNKSDLSDCKITAVNNWFWRKLRKINNPVCFSDFYFSLFLKNNNFYHFVVIFSLDIS